MQHYAALKPLNYDKLQLNRDTIKKDAPAERSPRSLALLACARLCNCGDNGEAAGKAMWNIPSHLAGMLLREAIVSERTGAMAGIVANWPLPVLCFREILPEAELQNVFEEDMGLNVVLFKGITILTRRCRMRTLDLRGMALNWNFTKLIVQMWPFLSLKKSQRKVQRLSNLVLKTAGLRKDNRLAREIIPKLIEDLLNHEMAKHPAFTIHIPKGEKLTVKIDRVEFSTQNTFFMEYLITNCLRSLTPVTIQASNLVIKSDLNVGDEILDSLAPFIAFRGQNTETIEGVWIENLEDNVFFITCQDLQTFSNVSGLGFPNCNIMLQEGRTRRRTSTRNQFTTMLGHFHCLTRLDLSQNSFAGCLKDVLDSLVCPLLFLSLKECDLCDRDIEDLAASKHAESLRQLDVSRICGLFPEDTFAVPISTLLRCLQDFTSLTIIHLQQNQITDSKVDEICRLITENWPKLSSLNIAENVLTSDSVLKIVKACARTKIQFLRIPYSHNFMENLNILETARQEFKRRVSDTLKACGRTDIDVQVCGLGYAMLGNL